MTNAQLRKLPERDQARLRRAARIWRRCLDRDKLRKYDTVEHRGRLAACMGR